MLPPMTAHVGRIRWDKYRGGKHCITNGRVNETVVAV